MRTRRFCAGLLILLTLVITLGTSCRPPDPLPASDALDEPPWFEEITQEVGLNFVHDAGAPPGPYFMPQIMGSGAALFDFDNDGRLDIYLIQNGGPQSRSTNRLYHQEKDGRFTDVSKGSGLDITGFGMGVAIGDVNNDGLPDVYVTEYGRARLFLNQGNGKFVDVTAEAGVDNPLWGTSACFVDYDRDGWLDLVVVNYVDYDPSLSCGNAGGRKDYCHPSNFPDSVTRLYHNLGPIPGTNRVRFEDVTLKSGLGKLPGPGLGVTCADFNGDHWPDIFVANDSKANRLWINQGNGTFKEEAALRGVAYNAVGQAQANMGIALGDVDGDGLLDLFVTHLTEETNTLWKQGPRGTFLDRTGPAGLATGEWRGTGFGTLFGDFDQDGSLDLAVVNGRVAKKKAGAKVGSDQFWTLYAEFNQLLANDTNGRFRDISKVNLSFCGKSAVYRGLCCGDVNGDGALDLLVTELAGPVHLFRNIVPNRGHWLLVRALDPKLRRDAYGAEITIRTHARTWMGLVNPGQSYLCSTDPRVHFGLGALDRVEQIEVVWPDGQKELFPGGAVDRLVEVHKGKGQPAKVK